MRSRRAIPAVSLIAAFAALLTVSAFPATSASSEPALRFGPPILVSPAQGAAWEPTLLADRFGNLFMTARKYASSGQLVVAPDERSPTAARTMSWLWVSGDGGKTWGNLPGLPVEAQEKVWGYEGDLALDGRGRLYFVDQTYADSTISRWTVAARGEYSLDFHRVLLPTGQPVDDRPWLAAHGDGSVIYIAQAGHPALNPVGSRDGGEAHGAGRYAVYRSADGGATFDTQGRSLNESGGCRPAADPRPGARNVYVACTNDGNSQAGLLDEPHGRGTVWGYVSSDDGATYSRVKIGEYNADAETYDWPLVSVGPDGTVWVLHVDADEVQPDGDTVRVVSNKLMLYRSRDQGRTWSARDITPRAGRYRWGWLTVSPRGDVAIGIHHRAGDQSPWRVYASVFAPGSAPVLSSIDEAKPVYPASRPQPPSEMVGLAFMPDSTLAVAWTRMETKDGLNFPRVYFARSLPAQRPGPIRGPARVEGVRRELPATGIATPAGSLIALSSAIGLAVALRRRRG